MIALILLLIKLCIIEGEEQNKPGPFNKPGHLFLIFIKHHSINQTHTDAAAVPWV